MSHWLEKVLTLLKADTANLRELARLAGGNPKTFYKGVDINQIDIEGQNLEGMEFSLSPQEIAPRIKYARRQEERAALILAEFLKDRSRARQIIDQYLQDKAEGANSVINVLKQVLRDEASGKKLTNLQIARKVSGVFARAEDKRHIVTYYLSKHLHRDPKIRTWLRGKSIHKLSKDQQREIDRWLKEAP